MSRPANPDLPEQMNSRMPLVPSLAGNRASLEAVMGQSADLVWRDLFLGPSRHPALVVYVTGLVDTRLIQDGLLEALRRSADAEETRGTGAAPGQRSPFAPQDLAQRLAVTIPGVVTARTVGDVVNRIYTGWAVLLVDDWDSSLCCAAQGWEQRSVDVPQSEGTIRGPKQAFVESITVNLALLRRILPTPRLRMERTFVGRLSQTAVVICYIEGISNATVLAEARRRVGRLDVDAVVDSNYVAGLIEERPLSLFPLIKPTERPDTVAADLCDGRVAIAVDGSPEWLVVPSILSDFIQSPEDYYERFPASTLLRLLRFVLAVTALVLPGVFVSFLTYHQEALPTMLLLRVAAAREVIPFPNILEALLMEVSFEALREAGLRLPRAVGQAVSIVGALVIGEAAVRAGIASSVMVVVVAMTGIASFALPKYSMTIALRVARFILLLLAGVAGLFGVGLGLMAIGLHLAGLTSFGVPYAIGIAPYRAEAQKDILFRSPWYAQKRRPAQTLGAQDPVRMDLPGDGQEEGGDS